MPGYGDTGSFNLTCGYPVGFHGFEANLSKGDCASGGGVSSHFSAEVLSKFSSLGLQHGWLLVRSLFGVFQVDCLERLADVIGLNCYFNVI